MSYASTSDHRLNVGLAGKAELNVMGELSEVCPSQVPHNHKYDRPTRKTGLMTINRDGPHSLYAQIAEQIAQEIAKGKHQPFARLSSEQELVKRFKVSRITVRLAIRSLMRQGLVVSKQGKGTYVAGPVLHHPLQGLTGFYDALVSQGVQPETKLLEFGPASPEADSSVANVDHRDLSVVLKRLYRRKGHPIAVMHAYLPGEAKRLSRKQAAEHTVYSLLQKLLNKKIDRAEVSIRARQAGDEIGERLGLGKEMPVLVMERISYERTGRPCERSFFYVQPEAYEFTLGVQGPLEITSKITRVSASGKRESRR